MVLAFLVCFAGVANRILSRVCLVPLKNHVFYLAQMQTIFYVGIYYIVLRQNIRKKQVSQEMLDIPFTSFMQIGALEASFSLLLFTASSQLPGIIIPILSQAFLMWQLVLQIILLKKRFSISQCLGVVVVACGVILCVWPGDAHKVHLPLSLTLLFILGHILPSLAVTLKEGIFRNFEQKHKKPLNIFVINSKGSLAQASFILLLLPVFSFINGIPLSQFLNQGLEFLNILAGRGPYGMMALYVTCLYLACNLGFNIGILVCVRQLGGLVTGLLGSLVVPLSIFAFSFDLPLLGGKPELGPQFKSGVFVLLSGLLLYNLNQIVQLLKPQQKKAQ